MRPRTFSELYCEQQGIAPAEFSRHAFRRALYPHARLLAGAISLLDSDYFSADRDFVEDVGRLTRYHDFVSSGMDYSHHPANRGFMRQLLLVRVSTERMRRMVRTAFRQTSTDSDDDQGTMEPFEVPDKPTPRTS
ncbi:MAG: hypothetical protein KIT44_08890 [Opitutaceae bacterium]|nr:hypothetical protein [Opitutaceae bacterium]